MDPAKLRLLYEKLATASDEIASGIYKKVAPLKAVYALSSEPVPFAQRTALSYRPIEEGQVWSERVWDCAWFRLTGAAPAGYDPADLCLGIDIEGEGCLFGADGSPVRGITNVSSDFDRSLGFPGKRYVPFSDGTFPCDPVDVWMEAGNNDLFGNFRGGKVQMLGIYACDRALRDLYYDYKFLHSLAAELPDGEPFKSKLLAVLERVAVNVTGSASPEKIARFRAEMRPYLAWKGAEHRPLRLYAVGHSHLDLAWLWPLRETRRKAGRTFSTALANMAAYPSYVYGASQPQQFAWVKEDYPSLYARIKEAVKGGRFELQGGMWVEADTNVTGGESLIRQFYYGKKFWREEFGKDTDILWLPDVFGFSGNLPQIMRGCGCDKFLTIKISWNMVNKFPFHSFRWKGIDGSEVLVHMPPEGTYNSSGSPKAVLCAAREYAERDVSDCALMLYGIGDGGGGPGREHLEYLAREADVYGMPTVTCAPAADFFKQLGTERERLPEYCGEMYLERHQGTYTSQAHNKRYNRKAEFALSEAEFAFALRGVTDGCARLEEAWKEVLLYQFHDIVPGSSIRRVYDETEERYKELLRGVEEQTVQTLEQPEGELCALNASSFAREEYVRSEGKWFRASAAPYSMAKLAPAAGQGSCRAEGRTIENALLRAVFDETGALTELHDKKNGRRALSCGNILRVYEDSFNAWDFYMGYTAAESERFVPVSCEAFNEGFRAGLRFEYRYGASVLRQEVSLCEGSAVLRFDTDVDWQETKKMLRADFYPEVYADEVTCDIQFGSLKRTMKENNSHEWAQYEICAHKWADMSERGYGVALLNDCKYGLRAKKGLLSLDLLRSQTYPCADQDKGAHTFTYALYPHAGDAYAGGVAKEAYALNRPLRILHGTPAPSLVSASSEHAVIETVKPAYDGSGVVARIYNDLPERLTAQLDCDGEQVFLTDMLENHPVPHGKTLEFTPFEVKTVLIRK